MGKKIDIPWIIKESINSHDCIACEHFKKLCYEYPCFQCMNTPEGKNNFTPVDVDEIINRYIDLWGDK
ncbi:MAG: hypothetical protein E3J23_08505 [Candidatus Stahlbacteria bacterium]|nr:MAG: hypothetical protein E3J23_08505 [Candidatus Stahlbacteria bacterium]